MRVLILTFGTRGDVQPYAALAEHLVLAGHEAALCTADAYRPLVQGSGVRHLSMGNAMLRLVQDGMPRMSGPVDALRLVRRMTAAMRTSLLEQWDAARSFAPDLLVYHPKVLGGLHIAERLGVPAVASLPLPFLTPTRAFPIPFIANWPFRGAANRLSYQFNRFSGVAYGTLINSFRRDALGLPGMSRWSDYLHHRDGRVVPVLYPFSPTVVPVPADYPPSAHVTGYWLRSRPESWRPPPELATFLAAGEPPVYLGLGSMGFGQQADRRGRAVVAAVRAAGLRAVVATGWGGLSVRDPGRDILVVDDVPHDWLFPQVAAVVHHGGAGTTAAGLHAGRPTLVCPVLGDQGFWGRRVHTLGAGPDPLPARRLTADALAPRLTALVTERRYRERALDIERQLRSEDGRTRAVQVLEDLAGPGR